MNKNFKYHIHISTNDEKKFGWKFTPIVLEKGNRVEKDSMYTKIFEGTNNIDKDIFNIITLYGSVYNFTRFKIELLDNSDFIENYNEKLYREIHLKVKINKDKFKEVKEKLLSKAISFGYALSNNPKEIKEEYITQFINIRFLKGNYLESNQTINNIIKFINTLDYCTFIEKKDELSVFDTNFTKDKWWAH